LVGSVAVGRVEPVPVRAWGGTLGGGAVQAVIFDLDGVLVDGEPNYFAAERRLLAAYGVDFTEEMKRPYIGRSTREVIAELVSRFHLPDDPDVLVERKNAYHLELVASATTVYPQTSRLLVRLREVGYAVARRGSSRSTSRRRPRSPVALLPGLPGGAHDRVAILGRSCWPVWCRPVGECTRASVPAVA